MAGAEVAVQPRNAKWHAAVARSTFSSQNVQNTSCADQFLKLGSRKIDKMAHCCGAKNIGLSKCSKHRMFGSVS